MVLSEDTSGSDIYYALHYCKNYRKDNPTFAIFDCSGNVALLIVDEFMAVVFKGEDATQSEEVLWGMNFKCDVANLNNGIKTEKIGLFPIEIYHQINSLVLHLLLKRIDFRGKFNAMHKQLFKQDMPNKIYEEIMQEVQKAKLADRFTVHNYAMAMKRVFQAHPDIYIVKFVDD